VDRDRLTAILLLDHQGRQTPYTDQPPAGLRSAFLFFFFKLSPKIIYFITSHFVITEHLYRKLKSISMAFDPVKPV
jgi:hypothetical protein